jgi:hypothetical protein
VCLIGLLSRVAAVPVAHAVPCYAAWCGAALRLLCLVLIMPCAVLQCAMSSHATLSCPALFWTVLDCTTAFFAGLS